MTQEEMSYKQADQARIRMLQDAKKNLIRPPRACAPSFSREQFDSAEVSARVTTQEDVVPEEGPDAPSRPPETPPRTEVMMTQQPLLVRAHARDNNAIQAALLLTIACFMFLSSNTAHSHPRTRYRSVSSVKGAVDNLLHYVTPPRT